MTAPDTFPIPPTDRIATALEAIAEALDKIEKHLAPELISRDSATPDPLERIAEALDSLASLRAAGPALKATGVQPEGESPTGEWVNWPGGPNPVGQHIVHQRRYRDGVIGAWTTEAGAGAGQWVHTGGNADIVAYRRAK